MWILKRIPKTHVFAKDQSPFQTLMFIVGSKVNTIDETYITKSQAQIILTSVTMNKVCTQAPKIMRKVATTSISIH